MTDKYLTAIRLVAAPWLELYENPGPYIPPVPLDFNPPIGALVKQVKFSRDQQLMVTVSDYQRSVMPGLGNPAYTYGGIQAMSPREDFLLFGGTGSIPAAMLAKVGQFYVPATGFPVPSSPVYITRATLNNAADVVVVEYSDAPDVMRIYTKSGVGAAATWALATTITGTGLSGVSITPDGEYLFAYGVYDGPGVLRLVGGTYVPIGLTGVRPYAWVEREDGTFEVGYFDALWNLVPHNLEDGVFTPRTTISNPVPFAKLRPEMKFTKKGEAFAVTFPQGGTGASGTTFQIYSFDGADYVLDESVAMIGAVGVALPNIVTSNNGKYIAVGFGDNSSITGQVQVFRTDDTEAPYTYTHHLTITGSTGASPIPQAISPDNGMLHTVYLGAGKHVSLVSGLDLATLPFTALPASQVTDVYYSDTGRMVIADGTAGKISSVKDGGGNYLDFTTLEGVFVTIYDREGDTFSERTFIQHTVGSAITDIVISKRNYLLMYHVSKAGATSGQGRFVFDIFERRCNLSGFEYVDQDSKSLAAISPHEDYFVVVYDNEDLPSVIRLYKVETDLTYEEVDDDPVDFGPPAFSACDTILVAHGGEQPYTLYFHDRPTDTMIEQVVAVTNWDADSEILLVAYTPNCAGVLIVTDDKISLIEDDEVKDQEDIDSPAEIVESPDDDNNIQVTTPSPNGGQGGHYSASPGSGIDNLAYLPYVSFSVTFRTW